MEQLAERVRNFELEPTAYSVIPANLGGSF